MNQKEIDIRRAKNIVEQGMHFLKSFGVSNSELELYLLYELDVFKEVYKDG